MRIQELISKAAAIEMGNSEFLSRRCADSKKYFQLFGEVSRSNPQLSSLPPRASPASMAARCPSPTATPSPSPNPTPTSAPKPKSWSPTPPASAAPTPAIPTSAPSTTGTNSSPLPNAIPAASTGSATGCRTAGIGCIECKAAMADNLIKWIEPVRERRFEYEQNPQTCSGNPGRWQRRSPQVCAANHGPSPRSRLRLATQAPRTFHLTSVTNPVAALALQA